MLGHYVVVFAKASRIISWNDTSVSDIEDLQKLQRLRSEHFRQSVLRESLPRPQA